MDLPAIDQLAATPGILRALLSGLSEEQATWKPSPDRFSVAEVLEHLSHVEGHGFRSRADQMTGEDNPVLEPYDQNALAAEGVYSGRDPEESFAHWEEQRDDNVELLHGLDDSALQRRGRHKEAGEITLSNLIHEWAFHDISHIRQIAELVRAQLYFGEMGGLRRYYSIKP